jgi:transposase-like protein
MPSLPDKTTCPRCSTVGLVRIEHVIQAGHSYRSFECHACGHQWRVLETGEHVPHKQDDTTERPDRSRPTPPLAVERPRR